MKKAGLIVAAVAGCMVAASPLAFAGSYDDGGNGGGHGGGWSNGGGHDGNGGGGHEGGNGGGGNGGNGGGNGGGKDLQVQNGLVNLQDLADVNAAACGNNILTNVLGILGNQIAAAGGDCDVTDEDGGDGYQVQNGLVNAQDLADVNLGLCNNNILSNVGAVLGSQTALAGGDCDVTSK